MPTSALLSSRGRGRDVETVSPRVTPNQLLGPRSALRPHQSVPFSPSNPSPVPPPLPCTPNPFPAPPHPSRAAPPPSSGSGRSASGPAPPPLRVARSRTRGLPNLSPLGAGAVPPLPGACPGGSAGRRLRRARDGAGTPPRDGALCRPEPAPATAPPHGTGRGSGRGQSGAGPRPGSAVIRGGGGALGRERLTGGCGNRAGGAVMGPRAERASAGPPAQPRPPPGPPGREEGLFLRCFPGGSTCVPVPTCVPCLLHVRGARPERCSEVAAPRRPGRPGPTG